MSNVLYRKRGARQADEIASNHTNLIFCLILWSTIDCSPFLDIIELVMDRITKEMHIDQLLAQHPSLSKIFIEFGLPCLVCGEPFWGTVEELASQHNVDITELLEKLNQKKREIDTKS